MEPTRENAEQAGTGTWDQDVRGQHEQLADEQARAEGSSAPTNYNPRDPEMEQRADQVDAETVARDRATHGDPTMAQGGAPAEVSGLVPEEQVPDGPAVGLDPTERRDAFEDGRPVDGEGNVH